MTKVHFQALRRSMKEGEFKFQEMMFHFIWKGKDFVNEDRESMWNLGCTRLNEGSAHLSPDFRYGSEIFELN